MELINLQRCTEINGDVSWKTAVRAGVDLLVRDGFATYGFEDAVYKRTAEIGAYYVLEKGLALVHAPLGDYCLKPGSALVVVDRDINFNDEPGKDAHILIFFTATDMQSHMKLIAEFGEVFTDDRKKEALLSAKGLLNFLQTYRTLNEKA